MRENRKPRERISGRVGSDEWYKSKASVLDVIDALLS